MYMSVLKTVAVSARQICFKRFCTASTQLIETIRDNDTGIDIISLASAPGNFWNIQMCDELKTSLLNVQNNGSKGIILTSSLENVFSMGGDIKIFTEINEEIFANFFRRLHDAWLTLYNIEIPIATAINGSSYGTGCQMALSTEYRVFVKGKYKIGMNETQIGYFVPKWHQHVFISLVGYQQAEIALLRSSMFNPEEALKIGLVNELAVDKADAIEKCKNYILSYNNISAMGRVATKSELRKNITQWLKENNEAEVEKAVKYMRSPRVRDFFIHYFESLKQKKQ